MLDSNLPRKRHSIPRQINWYKVMPNLLIQTNLLPKWLLTWIEKNDKSQTGVLIGVQLQTSNKSDKVLQLVADTTEAKSFEKIDRYKVTSHLNVILQHSTKTLKKSNVEIDHSFICII